LLLRTTRHDDCIFATCAQRRTRDSCCMEVWRVEMSMAIPVDDRRSERFIQQQPGPAPASRARALRSAEKLRSQPRRVRAAIIAPPWFELPPAGYGGIESVVADLVDQLAARGHEILLFGAGRHHTGAAQFLATFNPPP